MLLNYYKSSTIEELDLNCAETILYICNEYFEMSLPSSTIRLSSAFGGGMCIEDTCGTLTGGLMVLGFLFVKNKAHEDSLIKCIVNDYFKLFELKMGSLNCKILKDEYRTENSGCNFVIETSFSCLYEIISKYENKRIR